MQRIDKHKENAKCNRADAIISVKEPDKYLLIPTRRWSA